MSSRITLDKFDSHANTAQCMDGFTFVFKSVMSELTKERVRVETATHLDSGLRYLCVRMGSDIDTFIVARKDCARWTFNDIRRVCWLIQKGESKVLAEKYNMYVVSYQTFEDRTSQ